MLSWRFPFRQNQKKPQSGGGGRIKKKEGRNFRLRFSHLSTREKKLASDVPRRLLRHGMELTRPLQVREGREHHSAHHGQTFRATLINRILRGVMIASERRQIDDVN